MYEPVTIVKLREEKKITIPAGGWYLLGSPNEPLHVQLATRAELVRNGNVNEEYEVLVIGRIQDSHNPTRFVTAAEAEYQAELAEENNKSFSNANVESKKLQDQLAQEKAEADQKAHEAQIAALNKVHDATRNKK